MLERIIISAIGFLVAWAFYVVGNQQAAGTPPRWIAWGIGLIVALIALVYLFTGSIPALS